jgi:hypothetical protein
MGFVNPTLEEIDSALASRCCFAWTNNVFRVRSASNSGIAHAQCGLRNAL